MQSRVNELYFELLPLLELRSKVKALNYIPDFKKIWKPLLYKHTDFLSEHSSSAERYWFVENNTKIKPLCLECSKPVKFHISVFNEYCCQSCASKNSKTQNKTKETNLKKYGVEYNGLAEICIAKRKATMLKKYGAEHASNSPILMELKQTNYLNRMIKRIQDYIIPKFDIKNYSNRYGSYEWECVKCKTEFTSDIRNGIIPRCPLCFPRLTIGYSQSEKELADFFKFIYFGTIIENDRQLIKPLEIDIYLPELKVAIEYCGLYWHSDKIGKDKHYHLNKLKQCEDLGIRLITIFEDEWILNQELVKSRLNALLGNSKRLFARKTEVQLISFKQASSFLEINHIQGPAKSSVNLGLFYNNELVACMTFGKSRFDKKIEWELIRFANKLNYSIIGGASKLMNYFKVHYRPQSIISYSDKRWNTGKLYTQLGFEFIKSSPPNYFYFRDNLTRYHRQNFQKHKLEKQLTIFNNALSEWENMQLNGWNRIFDCGNDVFIWNQS